MSEWSAFEAEVRSNVRPRGPRCGVALMLENLPLGAHEAVLRVLADSSVTNPAIKRALEDRLGAEAPSIWSFSNHRRGKCACQR